MYNFLKVYFKLVVLNQINTIENITHFTCTKRDIYFLIICGVCIYAHL